MSNEIIEENSLYIGYDVYGPYGKIPNGFPSDLLAPVFTKLGGNFNSSLGLYNSGTAFLKENIELPEKETEDVTNFYKKGMKETRGGNFCNWSVCHSRFYNEESYFKIKPISEIIKANIKKWVYLVEPFGDLDSSFGIKTFDGDMYEDKPFTKYISNEVIKEVKKNKCFIVISYLSEGLITNYQISILHKILRERKIPFKKVIFIINDWSIVERYKNYCNLRFKKYDWCRGEIFEKNKIKNGINFIYHQFARGEKAWESYQILANNYHYDKTFAGDVVSVVTDKNFEDSRSVIRNHKFICLNRRIRPHRFVLLDYLNRNNLIEDNLVSFTLAMDGKPDKHGLTQILLTDEMVQESANNFDKLKQLSPRVVDSDKFEIISGYRFENAEPYLNTYFNLISETYFTEDSDYLSEKAWRGFIHYQPFIIYGKPGSLVELKRLGFKTFHPFINESYDKIHNPYKRMITIIDEVKRLCSMTSEEIHKWYWDMEDILRFNRKEFLKIGSWEARKEYHKVMIDKVWDIMNNRKY